MSFIETFGKLFKQKDVYFKFSTDEQFTGRYWIDEKKVYQKTVTFTATNETRKTISHNIENINTVIDYDVFCSNGTTVCKFPIVYYSGGNSGTFYDTYCYINKTSVMFVNNTNWSGYTFYVTIRYTKIND